jgi:hypothetical protein
VQTHTLAVEQVDRGNDLHGFRLPEPMRV